MLHLERTFYSTLYYSQFLYLAGLFYSRPFVCLVSTTPLGLLYFRSELEYLSMHFPRDGGYP
ncbi:hypothetical protein BJY00DRAFT_288399 [Aspergillus carlsbadensis]|nr:hypothetical protein BJY00DRAFT_288399 [Aspergillus carlsbadensis]